MQKKNEWAKPPHPVMTFHVGVTGHRALPDADLDGLKVEAARQFRALKSEILRLHAADQAAAMPLYAPTPPNLRCLCGLAEGADVILAEAALAEGWTLVAVLPFAREEFAKDFVSAKARARFQALLAKAASVTELEGDRRRGGEPYAHIGELIVEHSDMLLVIWDGLPPRGPGGTGDVVQRAFDRGVPVAALSHSGSAALAWHGKSSDDLGLFLRTVLLPRQDKDGFPAAFFSDRPKHAGWAGAAVRGFERLMLIGARGKPRDTGGNPTQETAAPAEAPFLPAFEAADRLADEYAMRYRAAGLLRFGLILPATLGALLGAFADTRIRFAGMALQFASLVSVLLVSKVGSWERWQRRFVAYRALAEYLRSARLLAPFASLPRTPAPPVHLARNADWTTWYGRAVLRDIGVTAGRLDAAAVSAGTASLHAAAAAQLTFLNTRVTRYRILAQRLRWIGVALFASGIVFEICQAVVFVTGASGRPVDWLNDLSLVLPGLAPVFLGLLAFGEYRRLTKRYQAVQTELEAQLAALAKAQPGHRSSVLAIGRRISDVMLAESADWQLLIRAGSLSTP
jgi:hypothetical protein